ncbi:DUF4279 domain-containing protein [Paenibacillus sp. PK3_47]|uniref:DUF4279 domain-containing protein n=1 Tax=Paenibacillus sp. PK3_47 TaxID=2072642 RepID=UPI00201D60A8|nr:DUF4279 domain-containing protein [Paenibacillus sp. PK3_47]
MNGNFTLSIYDDTLDFAEISRLLHTSPSSVTRKGEVLAKRTNLTAPSDSWHLQTSFGEDDESHESHDPEASLLLLLHKLRTCSEQIEYLQRKYKTVRLNAYLRSDFAQMGLDLSVETVQMISRLGLGLGIHILSYGGVESS